MCTRPRSLSAGDAQRFACSNHGRPRSSIRQLDRVALVGQGLVRVALARQSLALTGAPSEQTLLARDAFAAFDEEITQAAAFYQQVLVSFRDALARLRSYRNYCSSIHRLPPEVLQMIFRLSGQWGIDTTTNINIAAVCSHWRSVALGDSRMWSALKIDRMSCSKALVEVFLKRSKSTPLTLVITNKTPAYSIHVGQWLYDFCAEHLHRIQTLHIQLHSLDQMDWMMSQPAPMLEELSIQLSGGGRGIYSDLFANDTPRLRSLELSTLR